MNLFIWIFVRAYWNATTHGTGFIGISVVYDREGWIMILPFFSQKCNQVSGRTTGRFAKEINALKVLTVLFKNH